MTTKKMRTTILKRGVRYQVVDEDGTVMWERYVQIRSGNVPFHRPGGPAFQQAAREQEAKLRELAPAQTETVEELIRETP